jgi:hypothetical protein
MKRTVLFWLMIQRSMVIWPCHFGPVVALYIMVEVVCSPYGKQENKREIRRGQSSIIPFREIRTSDLKPPTGPHLLKVPVPPNSDTGWEPSH